MIEYKIVKPGIEPKLGDVVILETGQEALITCLDAGHMSLQPGVFDREPIGKLCRDHIIPLKPCMECANRHEITTSIMTCRFTGEHINWYDTCEDFCLPWRNYHVQKELLEGEFMVGTPLGHENMIEHIFKKAPIRTADDIIRADKNKESLEHLKESFRMDSDYARGWHDNIACCATDEGVDHETAQRIASRFMQLAFGTITSDVKIPVGTIIHDMDGDGPWIIPKGSDKAFKLEDDE